jgi:aspartyl protease family protein
MANRLLTGHLLAAAAWIAVAGVVYLVIDAQLEPKVASVSAPDGQARQVDIPRSRDGHYYVAGTINGHPVTFMVDTGATVVAVSSQVARRAGFPPGEPARFSTAGGVVEGETVSGLAVTVAGIRVAPLTVAVQSSLPAQALLGQNFLRHVDVIQSGERMTLRASQR